jgi:transposase InsO family protein
MVHAHTPPPSWTTHQPSTSGSGRRRSSASEALARFGKPGIFNTDQDGQFTSTAFTGTLAAAGIKISMDGRGRWIDNVFTERLWRYIASRLLILNTLVERQRAVA